MKCDPHTFRESISDSDIDEAGVNCALFPFNDWITTVPRLVYSAFPGEREYQGSINAGAKKKKTHTKCIGLGANIKFSDFPDINCIFPKCLLCIIYQLQHCTNLLKK